MCIFLSRKRRIVFSCKDELRAKLFAQQFIVHGVDLGDKNMYEDLEGCTRFEGLSNLGEIGR